MKILHIVSVLSCGLAICASISACKKNEPVDEAQAAGLTIADFPQITADVFKPMDGGIELAPDEIMGRNTWNLWSGGNQHFWNHVAQDSFGLMDLLKMLDNRKYPAASVSRSSAWSTSPASAPRPTPMNTASGSTSRSNPSRRGLTTRFMANHPACSASAFFPIRSSMRQRARNGTAPSVHGRPALTSATTSSLGRTGSGSPAAPATSRPTPPTRQPTRKIRAGKISLPRSATSTSARAKSSRANVEKGGFFYEMLAAQPPGTSDTSRIATDHINNPNAINAIFLLAERERIAAARKNGRRHARLARRRKRKWPSRTSSRMGPTRSAWPAPPSAFTSTSGCFRSIGSPATTGSSV